MADAFDRPDFSVLEAKESPSPTSSGGAFRRAGRGISTAADWLATRMEDVSHWLANLVRYLPARVGRIFATLGVGLVSALRFGPSAIRAHRADRAHGRLFLAHCARNGALRGVQLVLEALDLIGTPEVFAFVWRLLTRTSPLTGEEIAAAAAVLGPNAVRYQDIRVAQRGVLRWVFTRNGQRAFATFHTINLPEQGHHTRDNIDIIVHETIHVYQYERAGSRYFAEALLGQHEAGYDYGGPEGLSAALRKGLGLVHFNREQQAQIAQDYYARVRTRGDLAAYEPFIQQLREGRI